MIKNLVKHGNSWALIIDKPILELLNIKPESPLSLRTDGTKLIVAPADAAAKVEEEEFEQTLEKVNKRFGKALKRLA